MKFSAFGHQNITARHNKTFEFIKDKELFIEGDCIIGVNSDFDLSLLKEFIKKKLSSKDKSLKITIEINDIKETINAEINPEFDDPNEIVIRKTGYISKRTLGIIADKACSDLSREFRERLKDSGSELVITLE